MIRFLAAAGIAAAIVLAAIGAPAQERAETPPPPVEWPKILTWGGGVLDAPPDKPMAMPTDVAVGARGDVYVLDGTNCRVLVYDYLGHFVQQFGECGDTAGRLRRPVGLGIGPDGRVYVADSGNHRISVHDADGKALRTIELPASTDPDSPPDPTDAAVDPTGRRLYVADNDHHHVLVYRLPAGELEAQWGVLGSGRSQLRYPFLIDVNAQGYLLVSESINTRVQVFNSRGKHVNFLGQWGVGPGKLFRPKGVAALGDRVFVADGYLGRVMAFSLLGKHLGMICDRRGEPIAFSTPTGVAVDARRERLYVVELKPGRVRWLEFE